jgi:NADH-quinone oxidoreductase subunit L
MDHVEAVKYLWLIPLLPLIGSAISGFFGAKWLKGQSHWPIWLGVGGSACISIWLLVGMLQQWTAGHTGGHGELTTLVTYFEWIHAGSFKVDAGFWIDPLTAVMLCVVTGIGFFITVFSAGYMKGEAGYFRFFSYLGLFIFMMTNLVMGSNLIMLYLGWEGVGLCSYLLIGYYYEKPSAREAAKKAFLVNRVGDFGFGLGIMLCFFAFGTITYFSGDKSHAGLLELATHATGFQVTALKYIPFLLMLGAVGKSAQFPLYVWLPDAMEGPTPVSALIHAATMVTAGVYMIARCSTLFVGNSAAMTTVAIVGAFTALFAATIALRQFDLKKVFAYSTVSQLGFMFVAAGCLAPVAAVFHLVTHAFFKALLFLSCGVVMHAMMGELDMRKMSGLKRVLPKTNILMLVGCLALAGFPFFSGFFSKDEIVAAAYRKSAVLGTVMLFTAFLTAYYTFRLYFRVFQGPEIIPPPPAAGQGHGADAHAPDVEEHLTQDSKTHQHEEHHHNHEPMLMIFPLIILMIGAFAAGYLNWPERAHNLGAFLGESPSFRNGYNMAVVRNKDETGHNTLNPVAMGQESIDAQGRVEKEPLFTPVMGISAAISAAGILLAYVLHLKDRKKAEEIAESMPVVTEVLEHKYWVDEIYQAAFVEPLRKLGEAFYAVDRFVVDGIVWLLGFIPQLSGFSLKLTTQRGYLQGYAATMLLGIGVILLLLFL